MMKRKIFLIISFFFILLGCARISKDFINKADSYAETSQKLYQKAIAEYKKALDKDRALANFKLGRLYYLHGQYALAAKHLKESDNLKAKKLLALSLYKTNNFTESLAIFDRLGRLEDGEYLYYYGLNCEKLNLYDQALSIYNDIKDTQFAKLSEKRIQAISSIIHKTKLKDQDKELYRLIKASGTQEDYPQAGAIILQVDEKKQVYTDNTSISFIHVAIKILNDRGKKKFAEIQLGYDSTYESIDLEYARTIKPNGEIVLVGEKNIRDVSRYLNFPLYSNARVRIISMPEIEVGAVLEYKAKIFENKLIDKDNFVIRYRIQEDEPILNANFKLVIPKEDKINIKTINIDYLPEGINLKPKITQNPDTIEYLWQFKDINQLLPEANMVPMSWVNTTMLISTFDSWQQIYKWWWKLANDKIKADKNIKQKVEELIKDKFSIYDKVKSIAHFCAKNIRYVAIEYGQAGYEPHQASEVFSNKYGDCKDQAILLVTMLKEAGIKAYPVLIGTKELPNLPEDFPILLFNHAITAIELEDKLIFFDPTCETCSFGELPEGDQKRKVIVFSDEEFQIVDTPEDGPNINKVEYNTSIEINPDETIEANRSARTFGRFNHGQRYWLKYTPPQLIRESLENKIQDICVGAKLKDYKIENLEDLSKPIVLRYNFSGLQYLSKSGRARVLPAFSKIDTSIVAKIERKFPIDLGLPNTIEEKVDIKLPNNFKIKYIPEAVNFKNKWIDFESRYEIENNKIFFYRKQVGKKDLVTIQDYREFKNSLEELARLADQRVIIEEVNEQ